MAQESQERGRSAAAYLYVASAAVYELCFVFKLGATIHPRGRLSTYQTGCPPGFTPSHEIVYVALWEICGDASVPTPLSHEADPSRINLYDAEAALHDHFYRHRLSHGRRNDTEWFRFPNDTALEQIRAFLTRQPWFKREIPTDALPILTRPRFLQNPTPSNRGFLKMNEARIAALTLIQDPVIHAIREWFADPTREAGTLLAPCGSGKTIMTVKAVHDVKRMIICVPSHTIQTQWAEALRGRGVWGHSCLHLGSQGTNDLPTIREWMERDTFCIIVPYASSHHLVDLLTPHVQLIVLDEAHHMAGVVMSEERQEREETQKHIGITRSLMKRAVDLHIKRLSLTFTPRNLYSDDDLEFMSMDNAAIFGRPIAELNLRKLIQQGILPDYRIWTLRDEARAGTGVIGMAECLLEAWGVTELVRNMKQPNHPRVEQPLLHHMIVFAATNDEAARLAEHLRERLQNGNANDNDDTLVLCVKGGQAKETAKAIRDFEAAPRAILVNCRVLGEGVDIPTANAVAITYAKHAMGDITQMILRPGRWYTGKPLFHMLFPILDEEDMSGFQNVLTALASCDTSIRDEILLRYPVAAVIPEPGPGPDPAPSVAGESVERILIDDMDGTDLERIQACFQRTRQAVFSVYDSRQIQALCLEKGVDTSVEYHTVLRPYTDLPEYPRPRGVTWYDYLHPRAVGRMVATGRIAAPVFVKEILEKNSLRMALTYTEWREVQPASVRDSLPSVQHILDGYFGADMASFNDLLVRYGRSQGRR
jgi:superfamily II DNA or RNA helicase